MSLQPETFQGYSHMSGEFAKHEVYQCSQGSQGRLRSRLQQHSAYLIRELEAGGHRRAATLTKLIGHVLALAFDKEGCRVVQLAFQVAPNDVAETLVKELHLQVRNLIKSPHANYVVQRVVEYLPPALVRFVAEELIGAASTVARDRYGCRVLHRIFEHTTSSESASALACEVITSAVQLAKHEFGHFVVQAVLEHGMPEQKARIANVP